MRGMTGGGCAASRKEKGTRGSGTSLLTFYDIRVPGKRQLRYGNREKGNYWLREEISGKKGVGFQVILL